MPRGFCFSWLVKVRTVVVGGGGGEGEGCYRDTAHREAGQRTGQTWGVGLNPVTHVLVAAWAKVAATLLPAQQPLQPVRTAFAFVPGFLCAWRGGNAYRPTGLLFTSRGHVGHRPQLLLL